MAVQTLHVVGFPQDATRREVENLCRLMPGFMHFNIAQQKNNTTALFAKFSSEGVAGEAAKELDGFKFDLSDPDSILKAAFARRDLVQQREEVDKRSEARPPSHQHVKRAAPDRSEDWDRGDHHHHVKRAAPDRSEDWDRNDHHVRRAAPDSSEAWVRNDHHVKRAAPDRNDDWNRRDKDVKPAVYGEIDTIVVSTDRSTHLTKDEVIYWLENRPGFVQLQQMSKTNLVFVKFSSSMDASEAIDDAMNEDIHAELARRNLETDDDRARGAPKGGGTTLGSSHRDTRQEPDTRSQTSSDPEISTIVAFGAYGGTVDRNKVEDWFTGQSGYVALEHQENIGGMFIKYVSAHAAQRALNSFKNRAAEPEVKVEFARRNLASR